MSDTSVPGIVFAGKLSLSAGLCSRYQKGGCHLFHMLKIKDAQEQLTDLIISVALLKVISFRTMSYIHILFTKNQTSA